MLSRVLIVAVLMGAGTISASAQTQSKFQPADELRRQVDMVTGNLRAAVESAGGKLVSRARALMPDMSAWFENEPVVEGIILPDDSGVLFVVEPPGIVPFAAQTYAMFYRFNEMNAANLRNAANAGANPSVVTAPPRPPVPVKDPKDLMLDPPIEYAALVHRALVDAILDNAISLPLREGQKLTLVVGDGTFGMPKNPLNRPKKLHLQIKGEDLLALRANRITREVALQRITEYRY